MFIMYLDVAAPKFVTIERGHYLAKG
jgi:hypothetical protein